MVFDSFVTLVLSSQLERNHMTEKLFRFVISSTIFHVLNHTLFHFTILVTFINFLHEHYTDPLLE